MILNQQAAQAAVAAAAAVVNSTNNNNNNVNSSNNPHQIDKLVPQNLSTKQSHNNHAHQHNNVHHHHHQNHKNAISKPKSKPEPLVIPSDISAFQQQQQKNFLSQSLGSNVFQRSMTQFPPGYHISSHIYPHATLLKSPRLLNSLQDAKKQQQYTPPPMLSPFRKGPGLFYNPKQFQSIFLMPSPSQFNSSSSSSTTTASSRPQPSLPAYNHSLSYSYFYPTLSNFYTAPFAANSQHHQPQHHHHQSTQDLSEERNSGEDSAMEQEDEEEAEEREEIEEEKRVQSDVDDDEEPKKEEDEKNRDEEEENDRVEDLSMKIIEDSLAPTVKPPPLALMHMRSRLLSQTSSSFNNSTFFPGENDAIHAALIDCVDLNTNTKP